MEMKKEIIIGIFLFALIVTGMIVLMNGQQTNNRNTEMNSSEHFTSIQNADASDITGRLSHNIVIDTAKKPEKKSILVYKTLPPTVNKETTIALAEKFNVTGDMVGDQGVQSKDLRFSIWSSKKSGTIEYMDSNRPNKEMDAPEMLPSDDEAVAIATKFLNDRQLLPEGAVVTQPRHEYTYSSETTKEYGQVCIWFKRTLNGLDVKGTKLVVYIGGKGDVIGLYSNWRHYEPDTEYPIISQDEAFEKLKAKGINIGMEKQESTVSIDNIDLAYRTQPGSKDEEYLEPVWVFNGSVIDDGKSQKSVEEYIPALTDNAVKSLSAS